MESKQKLAIVIPCFNEEEIIKSTLDQLERMVEGLINKDKISKDSFVLCVDDGSRDKTWQIIKQYSNENKMVKGIKLAHNSGHQNALIAGLFWAKEKSDMVISIDADLQDDISVIEQFIDKYYEGAEIVYGVRSTRKKDSFFKRKTAEYFYNIMQLMGVEIVYNHADYRLTSKKALDALENFNESNLFLRGIFPIIGLKSEKVMYERKERVAGSSKYPLRKMLSFAWDGITSFSVKPLKLISTFGFVIFIASIIAGIWTIYEVTQGKTVHGWASTVLPIYLISGVQLLSLGIIGEYIGKIYKETKRRPRYMIEEEL